MLQAYTDLQLLLKESCEWQEATGKLAIDITGGWTLEGDFPLHQQVEKNSIHTPLGLLVLS